MIRNASALIKGTPRTQEARRLVITLLNAALDAVEPQRLVQKALQLKNGSLRFSTKHLEINALNDIYVIGAGKAAGRMAEATEDILKDHITGGLIIVPETTINEYSLDVVRVLSGGHPVPSITSIKATRQLLDVISQSPTNALVINLISGGGSALLTLPASTITLKDLQQTNEVLLRSGMSIHQINTVRKHLSQIKGGQLAAHIHPRHHWTLLVSDVPGEHLAMIASGPTLPDSTTFSDARTLLDKHQLWNQLPTSVQNHITLGVHGIVPDTPKPQDPIFFQSVHQLIGSNQDACQAVESQAKNEHFEARILTTDCQGEAREVGAQLGRLAKQLTIQNKPQVLLVGSETTVTVRHEGKGGRNTELITAAIPYLQETDGLVIASLATDGIDGPTDAAGAIADGNSYQRAQKLNLSPSQFLETNSTYHLFAGLDDLLFTGPTHTNVRDITLILWVGTTKKP